MAQDDIGQSSCFLLSSWDSTVVVVAPVVVVVVEKREGRRGEGLRHCRAPRPLARHRGRRGEGRDGSVVIVAVVPLSLRVVGGGRDGTSSSSSSCGGDNERRG